MLMKIQFCIVFLILSSLPIPNQNLAAQERLPVPSKSEQKETIKKMETLFGEQGKDQSLKGRETMIATLRETAANTKDDSVTKYVLNQLALDVAIEIGAVNKSIEIAQSMSTSFEIEEGDAMVNLLNRIAPKLSPAEFQALISEYQYLSKAAVMSDNYGLAQDLLSALLKITKKQNDGTAQQIGRELKECKTLGKEFQKIKKSIDKLKDDPNDPKVNQKIGEFYCFDKGDFTHGNKYVSQGSDQEMAKIANLEIQGIGDNKTRMQVGDYWWELAQEKRGQQQSVIAKHACFHYSKSIKSLSGVRKKEIEKRIADVSVNEAKNNPILSQVFSKTWMFNWGTNGKWTNANFKTDGTVVVISTWSNEPRIFTWQLSQEGYLKITVDPKQYFIIRPLANGTMSGAKYDTKTDRKLYSGDGSTIR